MNMKREWRPGDVAAYAGVRVMYVGVPDSSEESDTPRWIDEDGDRREGVVWREARPLVVIDPEDREATDRLTQTFRGLIDDIPPWEDRMQAALREFANPTPPRPEEPTGLGAVVEDAEGQRWMRGSSMRGLKVWVNDDALDSEWRSYDDITAVRVLSEGIQ